MLITLTARNDGKAEVVNVDQIRRAWVEPADGASVGSEIDSTLMLIVEFVGVQAWTRYVPVDNRGALDPQQSEPRTALRNFFLAAGGSLR